MKRYHIVACHVLWREFCYYASLSPHSFTFCFLPQGLHSTPDVLRVELQKAIDAAPEGSDAILVGYGLCSRGSEGVVARKIPLVVARAHDCITHLLGSKERYRTYFDSHPGTYWYSPGWIDSSTQPGKERYEATRRQYVEQYGEDNADYLMEMEQNWFKEYTNAAYVDLGFGNNDVYREYTKECADWLGWVYDELKGDPALVRDMLDGRWDQERFVIVAPGQTLAASHDEGVLKAG